MSILHFPKKIEASAELDKVIVEHFGAIPRNVAALFAVKTEDGLVPLYPTAYPPTPEAFEISEDSFATAASSARNVAEADSPIEKAKKSYPTFREMAIALMTWKRKGLQQVLPVVPIIPKGKAGRTSAAIDKAIEDMKNAKPDAEFAQMVLNSLKRAVDEDTAPGAE